MRGSALWRGDWGSCHYLHATRPPRVASWPPGCRPGDHPESKDLVDHPVPRRPLVLSVALLPLDLLLGEVPNSIGCERVDTERVIGGAFGGNGLVNPDHPPPIQEIGEVTRQALGQLNGAFDEFKRNIPTGDPFFKPKPPPPPKGSPPPREDRSDFITSFLCTAAAQNIFGQGASEFENLMQGWPPSEHPKFRPVDRTGQRLPNALTNSDVIKEIGGFYQYATEGGRRGTPHQL